MADVVELREIKHYKQRLSTPVRDYKELYRLLHNYGFEPLDYRLIDESWCLHLKEVKIPPHVLRGATTRLECKYDLDPGETLYSVKWYKDGDEFFRFVPRDDPPGQGFSLLGVDIYVDNCTENSVTLAPLTLGSSGRYRCEVSGEAPLFQTVSDHGDLIVLDLPEKDPKIFSRRTRYTVNEKASFNCTFGPSSPVATLSWFINGEPAEEGDLGKTSDVEDEDGLHTITLGIQFTVLPRHSKKGYIKLKCSVMVASLFCGSLENTVEVESPQKPPTLESREIAVHSSDNSHADRVQAGGSTTVLRPDRMLLVIHLLSSLLYVLPPSKR